jgi:hypothetical protein
MEGGDDSLMHAVETPECTDEHFSMLDQLNSPRGHPAVGRSGGGDGTPEKRRQSSSVAKNGRQPNNGSSNTSRSRAVSSTMSFESEPLHSTTRSNGNGDGDAAVSMYNFQASSRLGALNGEDDDDVTTTSRHNNQQRLLPSDERDHLQEYWIDGNGKRATAPSSSSHGDRAAGGSEFSSPYAIDAHVDGGSYPSPPVFGRRSSNRNRVRRLLVDYINLGVVGVVLCVLLLGTGLLCRLGPFEHSIRHEVGRFLLSAGIFGLASACSNFLAVKVLLVTMFLSRHESVLQNSVRDIVMNIFFSKDRVEEQLVAHVRKAMSTTSLMSTIQTILAHTRTQQLVRQYLDHILHYTKEGMMLSMLGVQKEALEPLLMPAVIATLSDLAPIVADILEPSDVITPDAFLDAMERVVSHRTASLDVDDLKGIVSGVLSPHLSMLVLWGSLFGVVVGLFAEVFTFSHFLSGCDSS